MIDKMAEFVCRNGPAFEAVIKEKQQGNPKFQFLVDGGDHYDYYQWKLWSLQSAKAAPHGDGALVKLFSHYDYCPPLDS